MERAISLLGNRTQRELKEKARLELIDLIAAYPDASTAANWKKSLRHLSKNPDDYSEGRRQRAEGRRNQWERASYRYARLS